MSSPPRPNIDDNNDDDGGLNAPPAAAEAAGAGAEAAADDVVADAEIADGDAMEVMDAEFLADVTDEDEEVAEAEEEEEADAEEEAEPEEPEDPQAALKTRDLVAIFRLWEATHAQSGFDPVPILSR